MTGYEIQKIWGKGIGGLYIILHDLEHEGAVRHLVADYHGISRKHWEIRRGGLVRREFLAA